MSTREWYQPANPDEIASPALLIFAERAEANVQKMIEIAGDKNRLRPHVKTHKLPQIVAMHKAAGINKVKCATLAEAEMVARAGVTDILWAYQPVGPNRKLLVELAQRYPDVQFGCIVDNVTTVRKLEAEVANAGIKLNVWIDIDNGNGRSGVAPGEKAEGLAKVLSDRPMLNFAGLHVYDGHFSHLAFADRVTAANEAFAPVREMVARLEAEGVEIANIVAGGSPTFPVHALQPDLDLSPGTYSLWDAGYGSRLTELPFLHAAVMLTRVISKPAQNRLCLDLGHKAVSGDNPVENRVRLLNLPDAVFVGQSEEHLVVDTDRADEFEVGDALYGIPWHVCPTVALHQEAVAIDGAGEVIGRWPIVARDRRLV